MRLTMLFCAFGIVSLAWCQQGTAGEQPKQSLFNTVRPEIMVVVQKHPSGSEVVIVSALDPKYPLDLLRQQSNELAAQLGQEAQGLIVWKDQITKDDPNLVFVKSQFGVSGFADLSKGIFRLNPVARAFAGAPEPNTVDGIAVQFENMSPGQQTLRSYEDENVAVELSPQTGQIGVEYRIQLRQQDPSKIKIPESRPEKRTVPPVKKRGPDWVVIGLGLVSALALGALVYSLLLRARPQSGPTAR